METALRISGESLAMLYCALGPKITRTAPRLCFTPAEPEMPGPGGTVVVSARTSLLSAQPAPVD